METETEKLPDDIFSYITQQENAYEQEISIGGIWDWNMKTHVQEGFMYKHSQTMGDKKKGTIDEVPIKNIIKPIRNVQDAAEDIDVKDVMLFVDDPERYHLSFLVKKYHDDVFVVENDLDTYFDDFKEEKNDFGLGLAMDVGLAKPEIIHLQSIAFCDQTDILSGPLGTKHYYAPDQLKEMESKGWGSKKYGADISVDELILLARTYQQPNKTSGEQNKTPGKYIEVYRVLGSLPEKYLNEEDTGKYIYQIQIVGFYNTEKGKKGVTLFKIKSDNPLKAHKRDPIFGRACGWGGVEELIEPQLWTTYSEIRKKEFLDAASKTLLLSTDPTIAAKHPTGLKGMGNLEIIELQRGEEFRQLDTFPRNFQLFDKAVDEWWTHAQTMGSAHDPMLGVESASGTPFRSQERQVIEGKSIHQYRQGKYAKFIEEQYRDWFIPYIVKQITKGTKFLSELSLDEMQMISDNVMVIESNKMIKDRILNGQIVMPEQIEEFKQVVKADFIKSNKKFIEILKDELKSVPIKVKINIKGKQRDLVAMTDKLSGILKFAFSTYNPQTQTFAIFQDPQMAKLWNQILESSGFSPIDYGARPKEPTMSQNANLGQLGLQQSVNQPNAMVQTNAV